MFRQGDLEKARGYPVSPLMDRDKEGITKSQPGVSLHTRSSQQGGTAASARHCGYQQQRQQQQQTPSSLRLAPSNFPLPLFILPYVLCTAVLRHHCTASVLEPRCCAAGHRTIAGPGVRECRNPCTSMYCMYRFLVPPAPPAILLPIPLRMPPSLAPVPPSPFSPACPRHPPFTPFSHTLPSIPPSPLRCTATAPCGWRRWRQASSTQRRLCSSSEG